MMKTLFAACLIACTATSAFAQEYRCKLNPSKFDSWVAKELVIFREGDKATVLDPIIMYYKKKPIIGKVAVDNTKRVTFSWVLDGLKNKSGQYTSGMLYRATVMKTNNKAHVVAKPQRYSNQFKAQGTCEIVKR